MDPEKFFIGPIARASKYIGDDGAFIDGLVYSKDAFVEGTHFKRHWMTLEQIAFKAVAVNVSDAVAMNAQPLYLLLAVGIPRDFSARDTANLSQAFVDAAAYFGCEIIGGDTVRSDQLSIAVTVISKSDRPLLRSGIKAGDCVAYTGSIGQAKKELQYLMAGRSLHGRSRFYRPVLRAGFIAEATPFLRAGMDISDGIFTDLSRLSSLNRLGFQLTQPISKAVGCSGEEYEMLIVFSPRMRKRIEYLARKHRIKLTVFARAARTRYRNPCKSHHL